MTYARPCTTFVRVLVGVLALASFPLTAVAQSVAAPSAFDRFMHQATGVGKQTVGFSKEGVPLVSPGVPTITPDGGLPRVDGSGSLPNPSGNRFPVSGSGRIPAAEVGKAVGRALVKVAGPLAVGVAIFDLAKELGFGLSRDASGGVAVNKVDPNICTVAPCYEYDMQYNDIYVWSTSMLGACQKWLDRQTSQSIEFDYKNPVVVSLAGGCQYGVYYRSTGALYSNATGQFRYRSITPASTDIVTSTQQEFLDAVAAKSGWPSTSNIARALQQSSELDPSVKIQPGPLTVTGPATSPGKSATTTNTTNNTTKTETTTHNHTYAGPVVNTTTVTVTNITNTTTGDIISNETKTDTPNPVEEPPEDECKTYPNRAGCADLGEAPVAEKLSNVDKAVSVTTVAFAGTASCPPPITFSVIGHSYSISYTELCNRLALLKWLFMAIAAVMGAWILAESLRV